jgi:anti-sigma regulatory factor (Ser/Thr protein kinase)
VSTSNDRVTCRVERDTDRYAVQYEARWLAERVGFPRRVAIEIAIVASELSTNILKYGVRGAVTLEAVDDPAHGRGMKVTAFDEGPPFHDFDRALSDRSDENGPISASRFATRRGIGSGLGAVQRLSDACGWAPVAPRGKHVWAVRWLRRR